MDHPVPTGHRGAPRGQGRRRRGRGDRQVPYRPNPRPAHSRRIRACRARVSCEGSTPKPAVRMARQCRNASNASALRPSCACGECRPNAGGKAPEYFHVDPSVPAVQRHQPLCNANRGLISQYFSQSMYCDVARVVSGRAVEFWPQSCTERRQAQSTRLTLDIWRSVSSGRGTQACGLGP